MAAVGRVLIIPRGKYEPTTHYEFLDLVSNNNNLWLCKNDVIGVEPSEESLDYWFKFTDIGVANDLTTKTEGYLLDARQGVVLLEMLNQLEDDLETTTNIAKGRNQARVFETTEDMEEWISNAENKGLCDVGANLYIIDVGVPDWWVAEVLETADENGRYYKIAQLEVQKVDLTDVNNNIQDLEGEIGNTEELQTEEKENLVKAINEVFLLGSNVKENIVTALQYSGLNITTDSTWEEIYVAFETAFPEYVYVFNDSVLLENISATGIDSESTTLYKLVGAGSRESGEDYCAEDAYCYIREIDLTRYSKISFVVTTYGRVAGGNSAMIYYGVDEAGNGIGTELEYVDSETIVLTREIDVSGLSGTHDLIFYMRCENTSTNAASHPCNVSIDISEIKLVV